MIREKRKPKFKKLTKAQKILQGSPQKKGVCISVKEVSPKKPNSANRKIAVVKLSNGKTIKAYIPGESHKIQEHAYVLVRAGKVQDLNGVNFKIIRGVYDANSVEKRKSSRSKYGVKKSK